MPTTRFTAYLHPVRTRLERGYPKSDPRLGRRQSSVIWRGLICRACGEMHDGIDHWHIQDAPIPLDSEGYPQTCTDCWRKRLQRTWRTEFRDQHREFRRDELAPEIIDAINTIAVARLYLNEYARYRAGS